MVSIFKLLSFLPPKIRAMKKAFSLVVMQLVLLLTYAGSLDNQKLKVNNNDHTNHQVIPMPDNGYLLVSRIDNPCTVIRLNALGEVQWAKAIDLPSGCNLYDAGIFSDTTIFLIYEQNSNFIVLKLSSQGTVIWTNEFDFTDAPGPYLLFPAAKTTADGSLIFVPCLFDKMVALKLSANGSISTSFIITPDTTGNGKNPALDAEPTPDNGMIIVGKNDTAPVIVCLDSNGYGVWVVQYGNGYYNRPYSITHTNDNNYLVGGLLMDIHQTENLGAWLIKISPAGTILWKKRYSAVDSIRGFLQLIENQDGTIAATDVNFNSVIREGGIDFLTLDANGEVLSAYSYPLDTVMIAAIAARIYKTQDGLAKLSSIEVNNTTGYYQPMLMDPAKLSTYCEAHSFTVITDTMPAVTNLPSNVFTQLSLPSPSHPNITSRDTTATVGSKDLCFVSGIEKLSGVAADILLTPNPASGADIITMKWQNELPVNRILITDLNGRIVKQIIITGTGEVSFGINSLTPGLYMAEVLDSNNEKLGVKKLMVVD